MRIAFLTPEYPSELPDAGGLATYVQRIARLLVDFGHEAEVFVCTDEQSETVLDRGVALHRVNVQGNKSLIFRVGDAVHAFTGRYILQQSLSWLLQARMLAAALERRHAQAPFQLVQSSDFQATGLFVRRYPRRRHVVRCSSAADLYASMDRNYWHSERLRGYLERRAMRRADLTYAPSRYLAKHFRQKYKLDVGVIRPPAYFEASEKGAIPFPLPERFFIHFGLLLHRKGTGLIAEALPLAWKIVPDLKMVWSGRCYDENQLQGWRSLWGDRRHQVLITGPLRRQQMQTVLMQADAAVLPSLVDNLPNTVIESLLLGIPVLGSRGASIDELVEEGRSGHLVDLGDVHGLANAMIKMWRRESRVAKGFKWDSKIAKEMEPHHAVAKIIELGRPE
jgi:glycosyltransferase involved in cell wall biosynthesis